MALKPGLGNILAYAGVLFSIIELGLVAYCTDSCSSLP